LFCPSRASISDKGEKKWIVFGKETKMRVSGWKGGSGGP